MILHLVPSPLRQLSQREREIVTMRQFEPYRCQFLIIAMAKWYRAQTEGYSENICDALADWVRNLSA